MIQFKKKQQQYNVFGFGMWQLHFQNYTYSPLYRKTLFFHCVESYPVIILNIFSTDTGTDEPQYLNKKIYFDLAIKKKQKL